MKARLDLITGFLGAGKTTLLKSYAAYLKQQGENLVIVENEFGRAGVDATLLEVTGVTVTQLTGGCICCGQKVNFHELLVELADHYDRILVEPSGIYTLEDFYEICESPPVAAKIELNTIITVLDGNNFENLSDSEQQILYSQCAGAGFVLVSKITAGDQIRMTARVRAYLSYLYRRYKNNESLSRQQVVIIPWAEFTEESFLQLAAGGYIRNRINLKKEDHSTLFQSTTICPAFSDSREMDDFISAAMAGKFGDISRLKGHLILNDEWWEINCTPKERHRVITAAPTDLTEGINIIGKRINRRQIKEIIKEKQNRA